MFILSLEGPCPPSVCNLQTPIHARALDCNKALIVACREAIRLIRRLQTPPSALIDNHHTVISNGAGHRLFFHVRSRERVGLRRENSLFALLFLRLSAQYLAANRSSKRAGNQLESPVELRTRRHVLLTRQPSLLRSELSFNTPVFCILVAD